MKIKPCRLKFLFVCYIYDRSFLLSSLIFFILPISPIFVPFNFSVVFPSSSFLLHLLLPSLPLSPPQLIPRPFSVVFFYLQSNRYLIHLIISPPLTLPPLYLPPLPQPYACTFTHPPCYHLHLDVRGGMWGVRRGGGSCLPPSPPPTQVIKGYFSPNKKTFAHFVIKIRLIHN